MWVMYVTLCHVCTPTWQLCMYHSAIKQRESVSHGQRPRPHAGPVVPLGTSKGPCYVTACMSALPAYPDAHTRPPSPHMAQ